VLYRLSEFFVRAKPRLATGLGYERPRKIAMVLVKYHVRHEFSRVLTEADTVKARGLVLRRSE
jgi:hypothetical protein